jgi:hypothetical protein
MSLSTPERASVSAVTTNAASAGPVKVPRPIMTRKLAGAWNGSSPTPSSDST